MLIYKIEYCLPSSLLCQAPIVQLFSISIDAATYAMVNVQKYQIVATGDSVSECEKNYMELMKQNGVNAETKESDSVKKATGTIAKITDAVVEGNTHQYILLENDSDIYDVSVVDYLDIVRYGVGDTITFEYMEGEQANTVLGIEK